MEGCHAGTHAVVTGASSGIGRATALALAESGATRLIVHYRANREGAEETVRQASQFGCQALAMAADFGEDTQAARFAEAAFGELGSIHTWVNNAGADVLTGDAAAEPFRAKLRRLLDVDLLGTIVLSRAVADVMRNQALPLPPSMVFIGWDQALTGMEGDAGQMFGPVKAAVMAYAASLAQSLAPEVRVNTIAPGWIRTSWGETTSDYWDRRARGQALMDRWGTPEDVARAVVYVSTPNNSFLTGQTIEVNGGWNRTFSRLDPS